MTVSNNVVFHRLTKQIGPEAVAAAARAAGHHRAARRPERGHRAGQQGGVGARAGLGVRHDRGGRRLAPAAPGRLRRHRRRPRALRAATEGERRFPERVARNVTEAMLGRRRARRPRAARRAAGGGEDRHRAVAVRRREQRRVDGRLHPVAHPPSVWMGTDMNSPIRTAARHPDPGQQPARRGVAGLHGRRAGGRARRDVPAVPADRRAARRLIARTRSHRPSRSVPPSMPPPAARAAPARRRPGRSRPPTRRTGRPVRRSRRPGRPRGDAEADDPEDEDCSVTPCG